ncbi:P-loop NTPase fold protein [Sphaerisporangium perillae]|uniref:P-loop NTPase fold protein n=1 Tax=Sphaerisporangium perillae TaxID=2935860 RepID=UPI00200C5C09|nr:P-loop NTPase fold protein [Sphaerisporangium perillae]
MTSMIVSAPPAPTIRTRRALVFLDRESVTRAGGGADRRLVHALTSEGYAVETAECDAGDHRRVGAFLDTVEPGDLLLVRWSTESGWGPGQFRALMGEFARRVERSDGAALLLVVDFGWLVTANPGGPHETLSRLDVKGEPVAAAAALTTSATMPGARPGRAVSLTAILADGILSGEADLDRDGTISVGDLYRYAEERFAGLGADRRPYLLTYGEGELIGVASARESVRDLGSAFAAALARLAAVGDTVPASSAAELVGRIYDVHLGEDARELLRRASLLAEDEPLTPETAELLTEGTPPGEALRELAAWGLLGQDTPFADPAVRPALAGRLDPAELAQVSAVLRRWRAARRTVQPRARLTGDRWTIQDRLGHRVHAEAVAAFIRHPETRPPLTIGIKGPWGAGKTSLMRMVQDLLDPGAAEDRPAEIHLNPAHEAGRARGRRMRPGRRKTRGVRTGARKAPGPRADGTEAGRVTNAEVLARVKVPESAGAEHAVPGELPLRHADWRPTVWFNPWMYQSGEQVWAGLAHEIISQVTGRLPRGERERFWLALNLARIDREAVRRRAYRMAATRLLPVALGFCATLLVTAAALAAAALVPVAGSLLRGAAAAIGSGGSLIVLAAGAVRLARFFGESADTAFTRLVRQPDLLGGAPEVARELAPDPGYRSRTGFLHLVQTDMRRVLGMVATEERPLVVFVDDLDRCSPGTVAQVIEAVNLFLAGEFPNCVFVLAMEPEVVAAHVEVAYRDLARTLPAPAEERSGLGWRFLEKIVQLPLSVPLLDDGDRLPAYLRTLLDVPAARYEPGDRTDGDRTRADTRGRTDGDAARHGTRPWTDGDPAAHDARPRTDGDAEGRMDRRRLGGGAAQGIGRDRTGAAPRPDPELVDRIEAAIRAMGPTAGDLDAVARRAQETLGLGPPHGPAAGIPRPGRPGPGSPLAPPRRRVPVIRANAHDGDPAAGGTPGAPADDMIGGLSAAARLAADRVYDDLYSDESAFTAIARVLPALTLSNPRELKRYVNVFRFYSFVTYRHALAGAPKATDEEVAKLAVLTIRWPHLLSLLAREWDGPSCTSSDSARPASCSLSGISEMSPSPTDGEPGGGRPGDGRAGRTVLELLERAATRPGQDEWARALADAGLLRNARTGTARWDALRALLSARPPIAHLARDLL